MDQTDWDLYKKAQKQSTEWQPGTVLSETEIWNLVYGQALLGTGRVHSNPLVGSVIVDSEHRLLGQAYHAKIGTAHAEVGALESVKKNGLMHRLKGAKIYVSLEPCAHIGRTGSCARMLCEFPLQAVHYARKDPAPWVDGKGHAILEAAGMSVFQGTPTKLPFSHLDARSNHWSVHKTPFIALKMATTLDGSIGLKSRSSRLQITSEGAQTYGHFLRVLHDAVLIGADTFLLDDPVLLPYRLSEPLSSLSPWRIVLDPKGRALEKLSNDSSLLRSGDLSKIIWITDAASDILPAGQILCPARDRQGEIDLLATTRLLGERGIASILLEGGAHVWTSFLNAGLVHRLYHFTSPKAILDGYHWYESLRAPFQVSAPDLYRFDEDWVIEGAPE